jgi:hypothetical protein
VSLKLSISSVDTYRARIKDKLGLKNAGELYQRSVQWLVENQLQKIIRDRPQNNKGQNNKGQTTVYEDAVLYQHTISGFRAVAPIHHKRSYKSDLFSQKIRL